MKNLKDYKDDLYKCSRCGLCQSVCPVYKATLNECAVSKGKFNMLNGVLKGDLKINSNIKKYLDLCTGCNACKDFCPSDIDARKIFLATKFEYYKKCKISFVEKLLCSKFLFKTTMFFAFILGKLYRFLGIHYVLRIFSSSLVKTGLFGKRILLGAFLFNRKYSRKVGFKTNNDSQSKKNIIFFEGCVNKSLNDESKQAVCDLLKNAGLNLIFKDFGCCGVGYLNEGNIEVFKSVIRENLAKFNCSFDGVITDCASCQDVLSQYREFSDNRQKQLAFELFSKLMSPINLLENVKYSFKNNKVVKVAIHIPCHEKNDIETFVKNIEGIEYVVANDYDKCCGFAGSFALKHQEVSRKISKLKAQNYIDAGVDFVLTTCPACLLGLEQGFLETTQCKRPQVMSLYVFLAKYCKSL